MENRTIQNADLAIWQQLGEEEIQILQSNYSDEIHFNAVRDWGEYLETSNWKSDVAIFKVKLKPTEKANPL